MEEEILMHLGSNVKDDQRPVDKHDVLESGRDTEPTKFPEAPKLKGKAKIRLRRVARKSYKCLIK